MKSSVAHLATLTKIRTSKCTLTCRALLDLETLANLILVRGMLRFLRESLGSLAIAYTLDDSYERLQVALVLFPRTNATSVEVGSEIQRDGGVERSTDIPIKESARNSLTSPVSSVEAEPTETTSPYTKSA